MIYRLMFNRRVGVVAVLAILCTAICPAAEPRASNEPSKEMWPAEHDREGMLRVIQDNTRAGIDRRLGPDYAFYHRNATRAEQNFPEVWMPPSKQDHGGRRYQIGGPWTKAGGDFSSTQGQVLFAPDAASPPLFPVDRVTILEWSNGTFSERPEVPWHGKSHPEPSSAKWIEAADGNPGMPIAMARGMGSWANCGVIVFSSGLVGTAGTVTANGSDPTFRFPPSKIPTAISVTNKNEFALVAIHDTQAKKGQVAVLALESSGKKTGFAHEWPDSYPCLPNVAVFTGIKLLGYVDLPGIEFPTGVCAVGNHEGGRVNGLDGNAGLLRTFDLGKPQFREMFLKGSNAGYGSSSGFAVAIAKYENKAAFIDLQPLFKTVRELYFTNEENFQKTRDLGPGPKQWPWTFEAEPRWKPAVVKVVDVRQPTAVLATLSGGEKALAFIASLDGRVGVYSTGGLSTDGPARPRDIRRLREVRVGRNPTCLAYQKYSRDTLLACSRGDREILWINYGDDAAKVVRRLQDKRMVDPVDVEVADTHGIETSILTVADFEGRKIINYRYSRAVFATQGGAVFGMGPQGTDEFECGGEMEFPGMPFVVSATNVN